VDKLGPGPFEVGDAAALAAAPDADDADPVAVVDALDALEMIEPAALDEMVDVVVLLEAELLLEPVRIVWLRRSG